MVATHESTAAPACARTATVPSRASMPRLAMVAVLETNPEASADSAMAWRACSRRRPTCASDWITSSTSSRRMTTCGFSSPCHSASLGTSGATSSSSAARIRPLRTSPGCSQSRENWCRLSRAASSPVAATASAAASNWSRAHSTPIR